MDFFWLDVGILGQLALRVMCQKNSSAAPISIENLTTFNLLSVLRGLFRSSPASFLVVAQLNF